jgi:hypothetical protein
MSLGIIASLILSLLVMWFVLSPLFEPTIPRYGGANVSGVLEPLLDAKERALRSLKDLEMDFSMGKLSQDDFEQLRRSLTAEVAVILADIKKHGGEAEGA